MSIQENFSETSNQDTTITFALMQTNFWVGDIKGNVNKMKALALDAKARGADIVIFPELSLIGYPPEDLLLRPTLAERVKIAMNELAKIDGIVTILGYPQCRCLRNI